MSVQTVNSSRSIYPYIFTFAIKIHSANSYRNRSFSIKWKSIFCVFMYRHRVCVCMLVNSLKCWKHVRCAWKHDTSLLKNYTVLTRNFPPITMYRYDFFFFHSFQYTCAMCFCLVLFVQFTCFTSIQVRLQIDHNTIIHAYVWPSKPHKSNKQIKNLRKKHHFTETERAHFSRELSDALCAYGLCFVWQWH